MLEGKEESLFRNSKVSRLLFLLIVHVEGEVLVFSSKGVNFQNKVGAGEALLCLPDG